MVSSAGRDEQQVLQDAARQVERLRVPRAVFRGVLKIAAARGSELPQPEAFTQVHCRDVSAKGFSFLHAEPPLETELVVALAIGGLTRFLAARVIHSAATVTDEGVQFMVGCAFTGRLETPDS